MTRYHIIVGTEIRRRTHNAEWGSLFRTSKPVTFTDDDVIPYKVGTSAGDNWFVFKLPKEAHPWIQIRVLREKVQVTVRDV